MYKVRRDSYFADPTRGAERMEREKNRHRERETARHFDDALNHFLAEKVNTGELVKLRLNDLFDLYEIPKDQLRGDTIRRTMEPTVRDLKGSGPTSPVASTCGKSEKVDTEASAKDEIEDPLEDMLVRRYIRNHTTMYKGKSCGHDLVTPDEARRLLSNPSTNSAQDNTTSKLHSADTGLAKDLACTENVRDGAINSAKRFMHARQAASWCPSSTPSNDREKQEIRNLSFCGLTKNRTPIPHISAWWNNMLMYKSQSLSH
jgi:hypothetical protein